MCSKSRGTVQQRQDNAQEQSQTKKESACSAKLCVYCYPHRLWLKTYRAVKLFFFFFIQTHPIYAAYCFCSALVPNITESNDFLITAWQQDGPQHGWWRSCDGYSHVHWALARFRAGQTTATYSELLPLTAAAFAWPQPCLRAWDTNLLVTRTEFRTK